MTAPVATSPAPPPTKTASWFHSRVVKPRLLAAYIWATLITPLAGGVALILLGAKEGLLGILFSLAPYRLLFWTALGVSLLTHISLRHSSLARVAPHVHTSRIGVVLSLLKPNAFACVLLQTALGGAIVKSVVGVAAPDFENLAFQSLSTVDGSETTATFLHEGAVFVAAAGCFAALKIAVTDILSETSAFPSPTGLRLAKMVLVRKGLAPNFLSSVWEALDSIKWFFLLYFFTGNVIKGSLFCPWLAHDYVCPQTSSTQIPMNSLLGLGELGVIWKSFVSVVFLIFTRKTVKSIVVAYVNEPLSFRVTESALASDDGEPSLTAALKSAPGDGVPSLAHLLAFQHLHSLLMDSPSARKPFFSLSQPGGHPHAWNAVSSACCDHLEGVLTGLVACNAAAAANNHGKPASTSAILKISPLRYLLQEFPGTKARKVFVESSKSIFAASSMSHLVAASFAEDDFGVVQKKLANILELLVNLYDAIEKNMKLFPVNGGSLASSANSKNSAATFSAKDGADILATARPALRDVTKSSIYRIVTTFGSHLFGIHGLTPDTTKRLTSFVEMKE